MRFRPGLLPAVFIGATLLFAVLTTVDMGGSFSPGCCR
jgi:hypothetical protein